MAEGYIVWMSAEAGNYETILEGYTVCASAKVDRVTSAITLGPANGERSNSMVALPILYHTEAGD